MIDSNTFSNIAMSQHKGMNTTEIDTYFLQLYSYHGNQRFRRTYYFHLQFYCYDGGSMFMCGVSSSLYKYPA